MEYVPSESVFKLDNIKIDEETKKMLEDLKLSHLVR